MKIARVALDVPLEEAFDFRVPPELDPPVGSLVVVPFGRGRKVGMVAERTDHSEVPAERLRDVESVVADIAPFTADQLELFEFCAQYYQRPLGETVAAALPPRLRQVSRRAAKPLDAPPTNVVAPSPPEATPAQQSALDACLAGFDRFHPVLLHGVTGSGKTEVYLRLIAEALARGRQALYLVPEIGLTPQLESQVRERLPGARIAFAHSHLSEGERAASWLAAQSGVAQVVLGTRLAVLMAFRNLGLVIVDEEHDPSYKQQEGLRYSARDVAVLRAQRLAIPIVLGSATPSLESWANAAEGRYTLATLPERAVEGAAMPSVRTIDTRADRPQEGLSAGLVTAIRDRLARGEQSLVFVNRRGYAPVLFCAACTWHSACSRCSANLVLHRSARQLRCHHCGHVERIPAACPACGVADLAPVGHGSQRVEEALAAALPGARIARVDRDSTARKGALRDVLDLVREGALDVLVGTQMLAKGHDYPNLTLVGVLESDGALFSADFRAAERLFALLLQVSGRAGRGRTAGEVLIQTDFPYHPLYAAVAAHDFSRFAEDTLAERRAAGFPPYAHLALLRAEAKKPGEAMHFLGRAAEIGKALAAEVDIFDPVPATLERKAGYERAQLLVRAASRSPLQRFLAQWRQALAAESSRTVRWTLDVDPQEV
jgi:primosomal protein N' (replication factor Y)